MQTNHSMIKDAMKSNPFLPINEIVYQYLRSAIIVMDLAPGTKLKESQIAEELQVSRSPVKAAISRLEKDMLVDRPGGKGPCVSRIRFDDCCALLEARRGIEAYAAYYAAGRITKSELRQLETALHGLENPTDDMDRDTYARADDRFHQLIIEASRSPYLIDAYKQIQSNLLRYRMYIVRQLDKSLLREYEQYVPIYNALKNHFATLARDEMLVSIERTYEVLRVLI